MALFGPLLGLAGSLIGASKASKDRARSDYMNSPQGIRENAEKAGFNPLVFAGPGTGTGAQYAPQVGNIIANGFATAADQLQEHSRQKIQLAELQVEKDRLAHLVEQSTLRPYVPGRFGNAQNRNRVSIADAPLLGVGTQLEPGRSTVTSVKDAGQVGWQNPRAVDAEMAESRYGDIAQEIHGTFNVVRDLSYDKQLKVIARDYSVDVANQVHQQYGLADGRDFDRVLKDVTKNKPKRQRPVARGESLKFQKQKKRPYASIRY